MLKLLISLFCITGSGMAFAQHPGYDAVSDIASFKTLFTNAARNTVSIQSDFEQEKNLGMLAEKIVSKGKFWFKKENRIRMEYTSPFNYLLIINKDKVFIKDGTKQNTISTRSNKLFQQINRITVDCVQGNILTNPDFKFRVFENKSAYLVELTPVTKNLKEFFSGIHVLVSKTDHSVSRIDMNETSGDNTIIRFSNKKMNLSLPDALFTIN